MCEFFTAAILMGLNFMSMPIGVSGFFEPQTVQIHGKALCAFQYGPIENNTYTLQPAANATIILLEGDIFRNDELAITNSDAEGMFEIKGEQYEPNFLSPIVKLMHNCGAKDPLSSRCVFVAKYNIKHAELVDAETGLHSEVNPGIEFIIFTNKAEIKCDDN